jgi:hypothetical protein
MYYGWCNSRLDLWVVWNATESTWDGTACCNDVEDVTACRSGRVINTLHYNHIDWGRGITYQRAINFIISASWCSFLASAASHCVNLPSNYLQVLSRWWLQRKQTKSTRKAKLQTCQTKKVVKTKKKDSCEEVLKTKQTAEWIISNPMKIWKAFDRSKTTALHNCHKVSVQWRQEIVS